MFYIIQLFPKNPVGMMFFYFVVYLTRIIYDTLCVLLYINTNAQYIIQCFK